MKRVLLSLVMVVSAYANAGQEQPKTSVHFRTYLTPSIPKALYQLMVDYINKTTCLNIELSFELVHSGPPRNQPDPFTTQELDIGHFCSPPYIWLSSLSPSPIELLPIAPIFKDPRANHKPIYFSDVIVASSSTITCFDELKGKTWGYNDPESLSGYFCMLQKLASIKQPTTFFSKIHETGSHLTSIQLIADGHIDGSAIDSNVLALQLAIHPELEKKIRVIESWGPFPIQPLAVRKNLSDEIKNIITTALLQMAVDEKEALEKFLVQGFGNISDQAFDEERTLLATCQHV